MVIGQLISFYTFPMIKTTIAIVEFTILEIVSGYVKLVDGWS